jgi:hypothetical protein
MSKELSYLLIVMRLLHENDNDTESNQYYAINLIDAVDIFRRKAFADLVRK